MTRIRWQEVAKWFLLGGLIGCLGLVVAGVL